jgi:hypothetical protein
MLQGRDLFATLRNWQRSVAASSDCGIKLVHKMACRYASLLHAGLGSHCELRHSMQNCNVSCEQQWGTLP